MILHEFYPANDKVPVTWTNEEALSATADFWNTEYGKLDMDQLFDLMKKKDVVLDATISVFDMYKDHRNYRWKYEMTKRITKEAQQKGIVVAAGSDTDQETFVQHEMKLLVNECDFTPFEAIVSATKNSAQAIGILDHEGTVEVGKKANLILLSKNPIEDINNIDSAEIIIKNGKLFNSKE